MGNGQRHFAFIIMQLYPELGRSGAWARLSCDCRARSVADLAAQQRFQMLHIVLFGGIYSNPFGEMSLFYLILICLIKFDGFWGQ